MAYPTQRPRTGVSSWRSTASLHAVLPVFALLALMWLVELVDVITPLNLDQFGIRPRTEDGLPGVLLAPLLHVGFAHLIANAGAFLVLGCAIAITTRMFWRVTLGVAVLGGLAVWLLAPGGTVVVGASGLVYGYATFLLAWGVFTARPVAIVVALVVAVVYGGLVYGVLPGQPGISWQGHLFGALAGVAVAWWLRTRGRRQRQVTSTY